LQNVVKEKTGWMHINTIVMKRIFYIHWNEEELLKKIQPLTDAGYEVQYHFTSEVAADLKNPLPDVLVISLDRLPSHGKVYAEWLWEAKYRRHIPIIFCGGKPEKVLPIKKKFPRAVFCSNEKLVATLEKLN